METRDGKRVPTCHRVCLPLSTSYLCPYSLFLWVLSLSSWLPAASELTYPMLLQRGEKKNLCYSVSYIFLEVKPLLTILWCSIMDSYMFPFLGVKQWILLCSKVSLPSLVLPKKAWEWSWTPHSALRVYWVWNWPTEVHCKKWPMPDFLPLWQILGKQLKWRKNLLWLIVLEIWIPVRPAPSSWAVTRQDFEAEGCGLLRRSPQ